MHLLQMNSICETLTNTRGEGCSVWPITGKILTGKLIVELCSTGQPLANKSSPFCRSQFFITFCETPHLNNKHTVFGRVVGGKSVLAKLEAIPIDQLTDKPLNSNSDVRQWESPRQRRPRNAETRGLYSAWRWRWRLLLSVFPLLR
jgi:hypothetical protein